MSKMGLEFFSAGLEFFLKTHKKRAWVISPQLLKNLTLDAFFDENCLQNLKKKTTVLNPFVKKKD